MANPISGAKDVTKSSSISLTASLILRGQPPQTGDVELELELETDEVGVVVTVVMVATVIGT